MTELPLSHGAAGTAVRDLQRRLVAVGVGVDGDEPGWFGDGTEAAVRAFQDRRGLRVDGICGRQTWSSLVEAGHRLGERFLYLRQPMLRGDDVGELQRLLGGLGFDAGRVDGIFGRATAGALDEFQRNAGLTTDDICGPDTLAALRRVTTRGGSTADGATVARVRETEALRAAPARLAGRRVAVADAGGVAALVDAVGRALTDVGAVVAVLHHPDESELADEANAFTADAFLQIVLRTAPGSDAAYYGTEGFASGGGRRLAELVLEGAHRSGTSEHLGPVGTARGMRLPVLRETRMPAVVLEVGPPAAVVQHAALVVEAVVLGLGRWGRRPVD